MAQSLRGADIVIQALERQGVSRVFTLSGNHIMSLFDAALGRPIDLVHVRHEAAAVHMADAWGRLTGDPGVAMVTGGRAMPTRWVLSSPRSVPRVRWCSCPAMPPPGSLAVGDSRSSTRSLWRGPSPRHHGWPAQLPRS